MYSLVPPPPGGDTGRVREHRVEARSHEHEPEVGRLMLPVHVGRRIGEKVREPGHGHRERDGDEGQLLAGHWLDTCAR